jgi:hypothetical protein
MRYLVFSSLSFFCLLVNSQQEPAPPTGQNELKVNIVYTLLGFPELTYERILGPDTAIGISLGFALEDDLSYRVAGLPYYRFYFGKQSSSGFFLELNSFFGSVRMDSFVGFGGDAAQFTFGLGAATGIKFLSRKALVGEVTLGLGRFIGGDNSDWGYPRIGLVLGKRF